MSLLNDCVEALPRPERLAAPPLPGEGPVVYLQGVGDLLVIARLAPGALLADVFSWRVGDDFWERCYLA